METVSFSTFLYPIFTLVVIAITLLIIVLIKKKTKELKETTNDEITSQHIDIFEQIVLDCVLQMKDSYMSELNETNFLDEKTQKEAINKAYEAVMANLTDKTKDYLCQITDNLEEYIIEKIQKTIQDNK